MITKNLKEKLILLIFIVLAITIKAGKTYSDTLIEDGKAIKKTPKIEMKAYAFELSQVKLLDGLYKKAMAADANYLLEIEPDRLLSRFREYSGLEPKGKIYGGWESATISGHTLGHYLSACSMMYASTGDKRFLDRVNYIVDELALCQQKKGTGFVGGFPNADKIFSEIEKGDIRAQGFDLNGVWVPWYTTHKLFAGLMDAFLECDNQKAKDIMIKLADWAYQFSSKLTDEQIQRMLNCEQGGIVESFVDVYAVTGDDRFLKLAERYNHKAIIDPLSEQRDILTGKHGNTNIPKVIGAAREYELTGNNKYKTVSKFFWEKVVKEYSYVIGGHGDDEYFFPKNDFTNHLTSRTAETCNTYNMLKLTRHLFCWDPNAEYADYYERAIYNHILASQDPNQGMMIYLCSLKPGHFKVYNSPFDSFWCCTGTGFENHSKYGDSIYFHDDEGLYVNLFIPSELDWQQRGVKIRQETKFPSEDTTKLIFTCKKAVKMPVRIRYPYWAELGVKVSINGKQQPVEGKAGSFYTIDRLWKNGDKVEIKMPMKLRLETLPGNENKIAIMYGPVVLSADLGTEGMKPPIPYARERLEYDMVPTPEVPVIVSESKDPEKWFKRVKGEDLTFAAEDNVLRWLSGKNVKGLLLIPFYKANDMRYTIYWDYFAEQKWIEKQKAYREEQRKIKELEARTVDVMRLGEMQPEREHNFTDSNSQKGRLRDFSYRVADSNDYFSFEMKVLPQEPMELFYTYAPGRGGAAAYDILVDNINVKTVEPAAGQRRGLREDTIPLDQQLTKGKEKVTIKFVALPGKRTAFISVCKMMKR
jgi:DUF1680 family protein